MTKVKYRSFVAKIYEPCEYFSDNEDYVFIAISRKLKLGQSMSVDFFKNLSKEEKKEIAKKLIDELITKYEREHNCELGV